MSDLTRPADGADFFTWEPGGGYTAVITGYTGSGGAVSIPPALGGRPVTAIGKDAFRGNRAITELIMPDTITVMQGGAFRDCASLKKIHLSNSLRRIPVSAFVGCAGLKEVNIPDQTEDLKNGTFEDCPLTSLHIGKGLRTIHAGAFARAPYERQSWEQVKARSICRVTVDPENPCLRADGCCVLSADGKTLCAALGEMRQYTVPEGVETIAEAAFRCLKALTEVTFPSTLIHIGREAFYATGLRSVSFGGNLRTIGDSAFSFCEKLTSAVFSEGLEEIGAYAFASSPIFSVVLPSTLRSLQRSSFDCLNDPYFDRSQRQELKIMPGGSLEADGTALYHVDGQERTLLFLYKRSVKLYTVKPGTTAIAPDACGGGNDLFTIILPPGLRSIGERAFQGCDGLLHVAFPESLREIGAQAFQWTQITAFSLPAALVEIGSGAFATGRRWNSRQPALRSIKVAEDNPVFHRAKHCLLRRKADGTSAVLSHFGREETVVLPEDVSEICSKAFFRNGMREVQLPPSVTVVGESAFEGCERLQRLRLELPQGGQGCRSAVIYFPAPEGEGADAASVRAQYMDCIRGDGSGPIFDFEKYDSLFPTIAVSSDKVLVAIDRLKSAIHLLPEYREQYLSYLRRTARKAVEAVIANDDLAGLNTLAELKIFTGENIDACIELANTARKPEVLSFLLNYKNASIGITEADYEL